MIKALLTNSNLEEKMSTYHFTNYIYTLMNIMKPDWNMELGSLILNSESLSVTLLEHNCLEYLVFESIQPSKYWPISILLKFGDRTMCFNVIWP